MTHWRDRDVEEAAYGWLIVFAVIGTVFGLIYLTVTRVI